jgi:hypothetical protein
VACLLGVVHIRQPFVEARAKIDAKLHVSFQPAF